MSTRGDARIDPEQRVFSGGFAAGCQGQFACRKGADGAGSRGALKKGSTGNHDFSVVKWF
jgi:hypothetical protein